MNLFISIFKTTFYMLLGVCVVIILAEITLQLLPVKTGFVRPQSIEIGISPHWEVNQKFTYSSGWRMDNARSGGTNNMGYVSPIDFNDGEESVIVIGDSYVENQMNDYQNSFMGLLQKDTNIPVYSFGFSGYQLADYIGVVNYTVDKFRPKHVIIMITEGDITSSLVPYQPGHYYISKDNNRWKLYQSAYSNDNAKIRNVIKKSALVRYLYMNLQFQKKITSFVNKHRTSEQSIATEKITKQELISRYKFFIQSICKSSKSNDFKITLLLNNTELSKSEFNKYTKSCGGIKIIDSNELFKKAKNNDPLIRLNFAPYDMHWNANAHRIIYNSLKEKVTFD